MKCRLVDGRLLGFGLSFISGRFVEHALASGIGRFLYLEVEDADFSNWAADGRFSQRSEN